MKLKLKFLLLLLIPIVAVAEPVKIDGIYYNIVLKAKIASVASNPEWPNNHYAGEIVIPETIEYQGVTCTVTSIEQNAFIAYDGSGNYNNSYNYDLISVSIPATVTEIGSQAFRGCVGLHSIVIPNSVTKIGDSAFMNCSNLSQVQLSNYLEDIPAGLFHNCKKLKAIEIPSSVKSIGSNAFGNCLSLKTANIPNSVSYIGTYAFYQCKSLLSISIPNSVTRIDQEAFRECESLAYLSLSQSLTELETGVFWYCRSLIKVVIPDNIKKIGWLAFADCDNLTEIVIGSGTTYLGQTAFENCKELTDVYCYAVNPPSMNMTIYGHPFEGSMIEYANLHVPEESLEAYKNAEVWKDFGNFVILGTENINRIPLWEGEKLMDSTWPCVPINLSDVKKKANGIKKGDTFIVTVSKVDSEINPNWEYDPQIFVKIDNADEFLYNARSLINGARDLEVKFIVGSRESAAIASGKELEFQGMNIVISKIELEPVERSGELETIDYQTMINFDIVNEQNLSNSVVDDVYYNVGSEGYDSSDGSIVIDETTDMSQITDATPGSDDVVNNFTGLILKVAPARVPSR